VWNTAPLWKPWVSESPMVTRRLGGTAASAPAAATAMPRVGSVTGSRAVAVTTTSSGVPGSRIASVTTLDIGASRGWVEAKAPELCVMY
jgi:hypothetical protein